MDERLTNAKREAEAQARKFRRFDTALEALTQMVDDVEVEIVAEQEKVGLPPAMTPSRVQAVEAVINAMAQVLTMNLGPGGVAIETLAEMKERHAREDAARRNALDVWGVTHPNSNN